MRKQRLTIRPIAIITLLLCCASAVAAPGSAEFFQNDAGASNYDYGEQITLPPGFGSAEFTLELWLRLNDSFPVGSTAGGEGQRLNWTSENATRYGSSEWWYLGNFLLDGHNNNAFSNGTFSLQHFNGGRLRWLFGDGSAASQNLGGVWGIQDPASASMLDGAWHQVTLVRRWSVSGGADLEMWIDGVLIDSQSTPSRTDMASSYWNNWTGYPSGQDGWFWAAEKQAAIGILNQYEDYKGLIDEMRFWSRAKTQTEIAQNYAAPVTGNEPGLIGYYDFREAQGSAACDLLAPSRCIVLRNISANVWSTENAPLSSSGDTEPPSIPDNLQATATSPSSISLNWSASSDNVAVTDYRIFRDGLYVTTSTSNSFDDSGLIANTSYSYTVTARDAAGNESNASAPASATTLLDNGLEDPDGDGIANYLDPDDDNDGVPDEQDEYPLGRFDDAGPLYWAFWFIEALERAGITSGCGGNNYCTEDPVTRAHMAVFVERGMRGSAYVPPAATGTVFNDVTSGDFAAAFIEQLAADGVTSGCGGGNYCPNDGVTRAQMAVFLLRGKYGAAYTPPPATGTAFDDVPLGTFADGWIEQLAAEGITGGCGGGSYCPGDIVTRAQMAVFLVRTFEL